MSEVDRTWNHAAPVGDHPADDAPEALRAAHAEYLAADRDAAYLRRAWRELPTRDTWAAYDRACSRCASALHGLRAAERAAGHDTDHERRAA